MCDDSECIYKITLERQIESMILAKDRADFRSSASEYPGFDLKYKPPADSVIKRSVSRHLSRLVKFWLEYSRRA